MKAFNTSPNFSSQFPTPEDFLKVLADSSRATREAIARQWLSEGLPNAFQACPGVYEDIRSWLAQRLEIHPKEITLIGSARIGFSLSNFGRPFNEKSDLDLCVVSGQLFGTLRATFEAFASDLDHGIIKARNDRESQFWIENREFGSRNIPLGFFDANKIPTLNRYPVSQRIGQSMWLLREKLQVTAGAPRVRAASLRAYGDWTSMINRLSLNLRAVSSAS